MSRTSLLILGHGSREAAANAEFEHFVEMFRARRPEYEVAHAYVELAEPPLDAALDELARRADRVIVLPLFLFAAGHVKHDVPRALARARLEHPTVRFEAAPHLRVDPAMVQVAVERAISASSTSGIDPARTAVVVVGRGSSDPDANSDFYKLVRLVAEGQGFWWVEPCFIAITHPGFEEAAEMVAHGRPTTCSWCRTSSSPGRSLPASGRSSGDSPGATPPFTRASLPTWRLARTCRMSWTSSTNGVLIFLRVTNHPAALRARSPFDGNGQTPPEIGSSPWPGPATSSHNVQRHGRRPRVASCLPPLWSHRSSQRPGG